MVKFGLILRSQTKTTCTQTERWIDIMLHPIIIHLYFVSVEVGLCNSSRMLVGGGLNNDQWGQQR
jgi:hypothetical protein